MNSMKPKYIKFAYRAKERLWLKVGKIEGSYIYGTVDSKPLSSGIKHGDVVKVHKNKVIEIKYK